MRKKEQRVWDTMRRRAPSHIFFERVENAVGEGIPDVHYMVSGRSGWIELKAAKRPARSSTRMLGKGGLRPSQVNWHSIANYHGVPSFVLIRDDYGDVYLIDSSWCETINDMTCEELFAVSIAHDWDEVFLKL